MNNSLRHIVLSLLCLLAMGATAQITAVHGTVSDEFGEITGASVCEIDGSGRIIEATVTDINGNFSMKIRNPKDKIRFSYVGCKAQTLPIDKDEYIITLKSETNLKEVTVVAKRRLNGGGLAIPEREISYATQTISTKEFEGLGMNTIDEALQGRIAGLDIVSVSGNLGAGTTMRLRGSSSISTLTNANPLIVVNGNTWNVDMSNFDVSNANDEQFAQLLNVNPEDISEITVLKDAAATAIYGSQGANGVIEIKTKRGTRGAPRLTYSLRLTGTYQPQGYKLLSGDDYTMLLKEAYFNPEQSDVAANIPEINYDPTFSEYEQYNNNTDWQDAVTQVGLRQNHYLSVTGGGEKATFRISGGFDHETGSVIKQQLDRFSTRIVLDYDVSDRIRFSTNFGLTYTDNQRNWDGGSTTSILGKAYNAMPNMSVYEYDQNGQLTGDYYKMLPTNPTNGGGGNNYYSSNYLSDMKGVGNPVAIANQAFNKQSTYRITPQFNLRYKLLSKDEEAHQLNLNAEVYMDIYNESVNTYLPSTLTTDSWMNGVNSTTNSEYKSLAFTNREKLIFIPKFNVDWVTLSTMLQFEFTTGNGTSQYLAQNGLPTGIESSVANAYRTSSTSGTSEWRRASMLGSMHLAFFDGRYSFDATVRRDGSTKFGAGRKWGTFPGISLRWNINQEPFFEKLHLGKIVSMLSFRPSWGRSGREPGSEYLMYNKYSSYGVYGSGSNTHSAISPDNLRLTDIRWEIVESWNLGANLNLFDDLLQFDFNYYNKVTDDLLMPGVGIPQSTGYSSLAWKNVGSLRNRGWELFLNTGKFAKVGKFSMRMNFNIAQNINTITKMDDTVLESMNKDYEYKNATYLQRIQIGNAVGSIYGFRYKGVYAYDYEHNGYTDESRNTYGDNTAAAAAERGQNATVPVARDAEGNILFDAKGNPLHMYFNYGGVNYEFKGGDAMYEDVNHDGQINELDIVYLGNSNPKLNGGFGFDFNYGQWSLKLSFNFRMGNKIVNMARLNNESMRSNINQSKAVAWRWRKNGDVTEIPRAMNAKIGASYNALGSDRYVEKGDYLRLQYMQLSYSLSNKVCKDLGISSLRFNASAQNLFCLTKYTGVDPEVSYGAWGVCYDHSKTPRAKSFTVGINLGF